MPFVITRDGEGITLNAGQRQTLQMDGVDLEFKTIPEAEQFCQENGIDSNSPGIRFEVVEEEDN